MQSPLQRYRELRGQSKRTAASSMLLRWAGSRRTSQCLSPLESPPRAPIRKFHTHPRRRPGHAARPRARFSMMPFGAIGVKRVGVRKRGNHRKFMNRRAFTTVAKPLLWALPSLATGDKRISVSCLAKHRRGTAQPSLDESVEAGPVHCARIPIEDRRTHRRSAKAHGVAALRDISAADDLGPRTTNVSFLTASALSTSARGTGTLPTTACDGCSPGLPLTTNPPLGRWCDSSGDSAGSGHGTEPSASRRRNRQQPSGRPDRGVGAPMWRLATALYSCQADTRTPRIVVVTPERATRPGMGEHP